MRSLLQPEEALPDSRGRADRLPPWRGPNEEGAIPARTQRLRRPLPCPAPTRGWRGQRPVTGRGEARQEVGSGSWVKAPGQERAPCAGSGRGLRAALVSLSRFGNHALRRCRGSCGARPGAAVRARGSRAGAPGPRFRPPLLASPLPPRRRSARLGSGAGGASFACGGAAGAGNRGTGSAGSLPGGDGPGGERRGRKRRLPPRAHRGCPALTLLCHQGLLLC